MLHWIWASAKELCTGNSKNMILKSNKHKKRSALKFSDQAVLFVLLVFLFSACGVYGFSDKGTIPPNIKTVKLNPIENKAQLVNVQLSQRLGERLRQKI